MTHFDNDEARAAVDVADASCQELFAAASRKTLLKLNESENLEDLCSKELCRIIDALPKELSEDMKLAMDEVAQKLLDHAYTLATNFFADEAEESLQHAIVNIGALQSRLDLKGPLVQMMTRMHEKAASVKAAFTKFQSTAAKSNAIGLSRAVAGWKTIVLGKEECTPYMVKFLRQMLHGITPALQAHAASQAARVKDATAEFKLVVDEVAKYSGGQRDGSSWKSTIAAKWTLKRVVEFAHSPGGLLSGPGQKVSGAKDFLAEALAALGPLLFSSTYLVHVRSILARCMLLPQSFCFGSLV
jgi:hypothetical protein